MEAKQALRDVVSEICEGLESGMEARFWNCLEHLVNKYARRNAHLLQIRDDMQRKIDTFHFEHPEIQADSLGTNSRYVDFLKNIGYLVPEEKAEIATTNVDDEIGSIAGPQLVCPVDKARFVLKACNARWGSMMDAVYASNILPGSWDGPWSKDRALATFKFIDSFMDECFPLASGVSWSHVQNISLENATELAFEVDGRKGTLVDPSVFIGFMVNDLESRYVLKKHGLHIEIVTNRTTQLGEIHHAGISDVNFESATTAILDMEDSVSAVDADDKALCYRNFASVMRGDLTCTMENGKVRALAEDKGPFTAVGSTTTFSLPGRVLVLVRNVGLSIYNDMVTLDDQEVPEHIVDAVVTGLCALHDLQRSPLQRNSKAGSVYVVKPKMHGPDEVQMVMELFEDVEKALGLSPLTMKVGIMDEERRTSINLQTCIARAAHRIAFINTGFLDRVGDEIHTSMKLGPFFPKMKIRAQPFLAAYEDHNVLCGLEAKFSGKAQIGKGMWAQCDDMAGLVKVKIGHPKAGANTAWVPSPSGATVHSMHYHQVNVSEVQKMLVHASREQLLQKILSPPVMSEPLPSDEINRDLDESCQSMLGYVVRWVDQGIGCSKVPDFNDMNLMEDRATLRISSQLLANWLRFGIITHAQFEASLKKMAIVVDRQNAHDKTYFPIAPNYDQSLAFQAARRLVLEGEKSPSGLTEPVLHDFRKQAKRHKNRVQGRSSL